MAPKRGLAEGDANAQPPKKRTSTDREEESEKQLSDSEYPDDHIEKRADDLYITMQQPYYTSVLPDDDSDEDEWDEKTDMFNKVASEHPDWPYKLTAANWRRLCDLTHQASYRDPDKFDLNVYTDDHAYGVLEVLENLLIDFNKAQKSTLEERWSIVAAMSHWLNTDDGDLWLSIDDGDRTGETAGVVGAALLSTLNEMDKKGELKGNSKFIDLGLVMALYLKWSVDPADIPIEEVQEWQPHVVAYAKKAGLDLAKQGVEPLDSTLSQHQDVAPMSSNKDWAYSKKYKDLRPKGGEQYCYPLWSSQRRKAASYTGKDPCEHMSAKDLVEGVRDHSLCIETR